MCNFAAAIGSAIAFFLFFRCFKQDERNYKDHSIG